MMSSASGSSSFLMICGYSSSLEGEARWGVGSARANSHFDGEQPPSNSPLKGRRTPVVFAGIYGENP
jgi:hypothetical protein